MNCDPIGFIRSEMKSKFDTPHQTKKGAKDRVVVELLPRNELEVAISDLSGFDYIWLISLFHKNQTWKPKVRPPRGASKKRGVLATRSPHRPNPIGLSAVRLLEVRGRELIIESCDLIDGTPILDVKPYIPECDSFPEARIGWLQEVVDSLPSEPRFSVILSKQASEQWEWLRSREINFLERAREILERDPSVHRTRRIRKYGESSYRMGCAEWRIVFNILGQVVTINYFQPGYPLDQLEAPQERKILNREVQLEFAKLWPSTW